MSPGCVTALLVVGMTLAAGCGGSADGAGGEQKLTVLAAASLTEPFDELAQRFEAEHPRVDVVTSYDSSATIAAQVIAGAPVDVVATADSRTMHAMQRADTLAQAPVVFARNELALVVPPDNPADVDDLADLQSADYVVCAKSAPCGALAADLLTESAVTNPPRSYEVDVKAVLMKVRLGEADAGLVYASDVVAAEGGVREIPVQGTRDTATSYPIAVTVDTDRRDLAESWVELVRSDRGQRVLARAGFDTATTVEEPGTSS